MVGQLVQQFVVQAACGAILTGIAGQVGQIHLGTQIVRGKGLRPLVAAPDGLAIGVHLRQRRWSKLLPLAASCPHKKARRTQRLTTWYQGVSASEIRDAFYFYFQVGATTQRLPADGFGFDGASISPMPR